jgi:hypothetical protein
MNKRLLVVPVVGDVDEFGDMRLSMRRGPSEPRPSVSVERRS